MIDDPGFSSQWQDIYSSGAHQSAWPWSDLVTLVMRHTPSERRGLRILELGVGAGANVPFFQSLGMEYYAVEGSAAAVDQLRRKFPDIADQFRIGDFSRSLSHDGVFDLIVDRGALTHNSTASIRQTLDLVRQRLKPGGRFIGVDWFSTAHAGFALGKASDDQYTRVEITQGHLAGTGRVHFSDEGHMRDLFRDFAIMLLRHKTTTTAVPEGADHLAWYDIVCATD